MESREWKVWRPDLPEENCNTHPEVQIRSHAAQGRPPSQSSCRNEKYGVVSDLGVTKDKAVTKSSAQASRFSTHHPVSGSDVASQVTASASPSLSFVLLVLPVLLHRLSQAFHCWYRASHWVSGMREGASDGEGPSGPGKTKGRRGKRAKA